MLRNKNFRFFWQKNKVHQYLTKKLIIQVSKIRSEKTESTIRYTGNGSNAK